MKRNMTKMLNVLIIFGTIFIFANSANAQGYTQSEQSCFDAVQGKVAWSKAGDKQWETSDVRRLCEGTTNPSATISCFRSEIDKHDDRNRAIEACKSKQCQNRTSTIKFGGLSKYYSDGCSCSAVSLEDFGKNTSTKAIFESPISSKNDTAYINIGGTDMKFNLLKRVRKQYSKSWTEIYESDGSVLKVDYVFFKGLGDSAETDEGSIYDITLTILKYGEIGVIDARGVCGC